MRKTYEEDEVEEEEEEQVVKEEENESEVTEHIKKNSKVRLHIADRFYFVCNLNAMTKRMNQKSN